MRVEKDRPGTWVKYRDGLCTTCTATCCTMPVEVTIEDLVQLGEISVDDVHVSRRKLVNQLKRQGLISSYREGTGKFMLTSRPNGDCLFLDANTRLCTVYAKRPQLCRNFPMKVGNRLGHCPAIRKAKA